MVLQDIKNTSGSEGDPPALASRRKKLVRRLKKVPATSEPDLTSPTQALLNVPLLQRLQMAMSKHKESDACLQSNLNSEKLGECDSGAVASVGDCLVEALGVAESPDDGLPTLVCDIDMAPGDECDNEDVTAICTNVLDIDIGLMTVNKNGAPLAEDPQLDAPQELCGSQSGLDLEMTDAGDDGSLDQAFINVTSGDQSQIADATNSDSCLLEIVSTVDGLVLDTDEGTQVAGPVKPNCLRMPPDLLEIAEGHQNTTTNIQKIELGKTSSNTDSTETNVVSVIMGEQAPLQSQSIGGRHRSEGRCRKVQVLHTDTTDSGSSKKLLPGESPSSTQPPQLQITESVEGSLLDALDLDLHILPEKMDSKWRKDVSRRHSHQVFLGQPPQVGTTSLLEKTVPTIQSQDAEEALDPSLCIINDGPRGSRGQRKKSPPGPMTAMPPEVTPSLLEDHENDRIAELDKETCVLQLSGDDSVTEHQLTVSHSDASSADLTTTGSEDNLSIPIQPSQPQTTTGDPQDQKAAVAPVVVSRKRGYKRRKALSMKHSQEVLPCEPPQRDTSTLLDEAEPPTKGQDASSADLTTTGLEDNLSLPTQPFQPQTTAGDPQDLPAAVAPVVVSRKRGDKRRKALSMKHPPEVVPNEPLQGETILLDKAEPSTNDQISHSDASSADLTTTALEDNLSLPTQPSQPQTTTGDPQDLKAAVAPVVVSRKRGDKRRKALSMKHSPELLPNEPLQGETSRLDEAEPRTKDQESVEVRDTLPTSLCFINDSQRSSRRHHKQSPESLSTKSSECTQSVSECHGDNQTDGSGGDSFMIQLSADTVITGLHVMDKANELSSETIQDNELTEPEVVQDDPAPSLCVISEVSNASHSRQESSTPNQEGDNKTATQEDNHTIVCPEVKVQEGTESEVVQDNAAPSLHAINEVHKAPRIRRKRSPPIREGDRMTATHEDNQVIICPEVYVKKESDAMQDVQAPSLCVINEGHKLCSRRKRTPPMQDGDNTPVIQQDNQAIISPEVNVQKGTESDAMQDVPAPSLCVINEGRKPCSRRKRTPSKQGGDNTPVIQQDNQTIISPAVNVQKETESEVVQDDTALSLCASNEVRKATHIRHKMSSVKQDGDRKTGIQEDHHAIIHPEVNIQKGTESELVQDNPAPSLCVISEVCKSSRSRCKKTPPKQEGDNTLLIQEDNQAIICSEVNLQNKTVSDSGTISIVLTTAPMEDTPPPLPPTQSFRDETILFVAEDLGNDLAPDLDQDILSSRRGSKRRKNSSRRRSQQAFPCLPPRGGITSLLEETGSATQGQESEDLDAMPSLCVINDGRRGSRGRRKRSPPESVTTTSPEDAPSVLECSEGNRMAEFSEVDRMAQLSVDVTMTGYHVMDRANEFSRETIQDNQLTATLAVTEDVPKECGVKWQRVCEIEDDIPQTGDGMLLFTDEPIEAVPIDAEPICVINDRRRRRGGKKHVQAVLATPSTACSATMHGTAKELALVASSSDMEPILKTCIADPPMSKADNEESKINIAKRGRPINNGLKQDPCTSEGDTSQHELPVSERRKPHAESSEFDDLDEILAPASKPAKPKRRKRTSDYDISNAILLSSPEDPSVDLDLPVNPVSSRRSKRLRRKSLDLYRVSIEKKKEEEEQKRRYTVQSAESIAQLEEQEYSLKMVDVHLNVVVEDTVEAECGDSFRGVSKDLLDAANENSNAEVLDSSSEAGSSCPMKATPAATTALAELDEVSPTDPVDLKPKPRRGGKKKANQPTLEDLYLNKLWRTQMPKDKVWETIFENPRATKWGTEELMSIKRLKRHVNFDDFYLTARLKRRRQKAMKLGWRPLTEKQDLVAATNLEERLQLLERQLSEETTPVQSPMQRLCWSNETSDLPGSRTPALTEDPDDCFYTPVKSSGNPLMEEFEDNDKSVCISSADCTLSPTALTEPLGSTALLSGSSSGTPRKITNP